MFVLVCVSVCVCLCVSCFKHVFVCFVGGILCDVVWAVCVFLLFGLSWCEFVCAV